MAYRIKYTTICKDTGDVQIIEARAADEIAARNIVKDTVQRHKSGGDVYSKVDYRLCIEKNGKTILTETSTS